ncbi:DUF3501 family protein [Candidatus Pelagibacter sp.]|nr:DUF3501 family protein [Candidatus Pelagibacter sp.]
MSKEKRQIEKEDLLPSDVYAKSRKQIRKDLVEFKKDRRIALGPYATFYFESFETMVAQVQEMLHIEKGGDEQLKDELIAYNPLVPNGKELTATLMFEIDNPISRAAFLGKVGGIEEKIFIKINDEIIKAVPEADVDRTSAEGKASSVQFIHFKLTDDQISKFKSDSTTIELGIDHKEYTHTTKLAENSVKSLCADFI